MQKFQYSALTTQEWKNFLYEYFDAEKDKLDQGKCKEIDFFFQFFLYEVSYCYLKDCFAF